MLVILFLAVGVACMLCNTKRKDSVLLIAGLLLFIAGVLLQVNTGDEQKMIEQKQLLESVIDSRYYIILCDKDNKVVYRYVDDNDKGWTGEIIAENYKIIQEEGTEPRIEKYKDKVIGVIRLNLNPKEEIRLYVPINGICTIYKN